MKKEIISKAVKEFMDFNEHVLESNKITKASITGDPKIFIDAWAVRNDLMESPIVVGFEYIESFQSILKNIEKILANNHYLKPYEKMHNIKTLSDIKRLGELLDKKTANEIKSCLAVSDLTAKTLYLRICNWLTDFIGCSTSYNNCFNSCASYLDGGVGKSTPYFYGINEHYYVATVHYTKEDALNRTSNSIIGRAIINTDFNGKLMVHRIYGGNEMSVYNVRESFQKAIQSATNCNNNVEDDCSKQYKLKIVTPDNHLNYYFDCNYNYINVSTYTLDDKKDFTFNFLPYDYVKDMTSSYWNNDLMKSYL